MEYIYKARTKDGKLETGTIEAYSQEAAAALLQKYNVFVTSLEEKKSKGSLLMKMELSRRVSKKDLAIFFRQLSLLLESRVPVVQSLFSLASETRKISFKETILNVSSLVEEGIPLSEALARHPKVFSPFYINLVRSGEASGKISGALYSVSEHLERESDIIAQVRQATIYPLFVLAVVFIVMVVIVARLIPRISDLIKETNVEPPLFTVIILSFYGFLEAYWWLLLVILMLGIVLLVYYVNTSEGRKRYDKISLKIPLLRDFLREVFLVRFCSNISTLVLAGISLNRALRITEDTVNNSVYKGLINDIEKRVSEGEKMSSAMSKHGQYFPLFVVQMVKVGEETGRLDKVLQDTVVFYQKDIKRTVDLFATLLEPIIIIILGIFIALLAVSVIFAIYGTIQTL